MVGTAAPALLAALLGAAAAAGGAPFDLPNPQLPQALNIDTIYVEGRKEFLEQTLGETEPGVERWIIRVKEGTLQGRVSALLVEPELKLMSCGRPTRFFTFRGSLGQIEALVQKHADTVDYYEPDAEARAIPEVGVQPQGWFGRHLPKETPWGIARVGARLQTNTGKGVHVYVFDTGVRCTHEEFAGGAGGEQRCIPTLEVLNIGTGVECNPTKPNCAIDRNGHGTHCAATAAGGRYGVATAATVHAMKVLNDNAGGAPSWALCAMLWLGEGNNAQKPAVASMSIAARAEQHSDAEGVEVLTNAGIPVVVAAGNADSGSEACDWSPAFVPLAITVGAHDLSDAMDAFSNYGTCVNIFAPGLWVKSAWVCDNEKDCGGIAPSDTATAWHSGTSMACPHVSGAFALKMEKNPEGTVQEWRDAVLVRSDHDALQSCQKNSPPIILRVGGTYDEECVDSSDYKDWWGWSCGWWWGFSCTWTFFFVYPEVELAAVRNLCRSSCGICQTNKGGC